MTTELWPTYELRPLNSRYVVTRALKAINNILKFFIPFEMENNPWEVQSFKYKTLENMSEFVMFMKTDKRIQLHIIYLHEILKMVMC